MNLVLLNDTDFIEDDLVEIKGRRFDHLCAVTRIQTGQTLVCGKINSKMGTGHIEKMSQDSCQIRVMLSSQPPDPIPLKLILALPRPKMFRRILQAVTSLGVKEIHLINSWRVEKSFWKSPVLSDESIYHQMILGLEQSKDTLLPKIEFHRFFKGFVENKLPLICQDTNCITAHPKSDQLCPMAVDEPATLVIGPEGGFIDKEIESLEKIGFNSYHLGNRILRVEQAVTYLIARLFS